MARATDTVQTLVVNVSTVVTEESEPGGMGWCDTDRRVITIDSEMCEGQRIGNTLPAAFQQIDTRNYHYHGTDVCFGVVGTIDSARCQET